MKTRYIIVMDVDRKNDKILHKAATTFSQGVEGFLTGLLCVSIDDAIQGDASSDFVSSNNKVMINCVSEEIP